MAARSRAGGVEQLHDLVGEAAGVLLGQRDPGEEPGQRHGDDGGGTPFGRRGRRRRLRGPRLHGCSSQTRPGSRPWRRCLLGRSGRPGSRAATVAAAASSGGPSRAPRPWPPSGAAWPAWPASGWRRRRTAGRSAGGALGAQPVGQGHAAVAARRLPEHGELVDDRVGPEAVDRAEQAVASRASAITGVTPSASRRRPAPGIAGQAEHLVAMGDELAVDGVGDGVQPAGHGESGQGDQQAVGPEQGQQHRDAEARVIWFPKVGNSSSDWAM